MDQKTGGGDYADFAPVAQDESRLNENSKLSSIVDDSAIRPFKFAAGVDSQLSKKSNQNALHLLSAATSPSMLRTQPDFQMRSNQAPSNPQAMNHLITSATSNDYARNLTPQ